MEEALDTAILEGQVDETEPEEQSKEEVQIEITEAVESLPQIDDIENVEKTKDTEIVAEEQMSEEQENIGTAEVGETSVVEEEAVAAIDDTELTFDVDAVVITSEAEAAEENVSEEILGEIESAEENVEEVPEIGTKEEKAEKETKEEKAEKETKEEMTEEETKEMAEKETKEEAAEIEPTEALEEVESRIEQTEIESIEKTEDIEEEEIEDLPKDEAQVPEVLKTKSEETDIERKSFVELLQKRPSSIETPGHITRSAIHETISAVSARESISSDDMEQGIMEATTIEPKFDDYTLAKRSKHRYANSYQLKPLYDFQVDKVTSIIHDLLHQVLTGRKYDQVVSMQAARELSGVILNKVKHLGYNRHKFVSIVYIGQKKAQSVTLVAGGLWDSQFDNYASATFESCQLFAVGTVFATYYE